MSIHITDIQRLCRQLGFDPSEVEHIRITPSRVYANTYLFDESGEHVMKYDAAVTVKHVLPVDREPLREDTPIFHDLVGYACMTPTFPCSMDTALGLVA